jgi:hypothetical protein
MLIVGAASSRDFPKQAQTTLNHVGHLQMK